MGQHGEYGHMVEVVAVPVLSDNYVWLMHEADETVVVDPGEAAPVLAALDARGWRATAIWNTHWHPDHTAGNAAVRSATGAPITGPAAEADRIPTLDHTVAGGDAFDWAGQRVEVVDTPAHTNGAVSFHLANPGVAFVGDTLFAMGCGRLFEGTAEQMFAAMRVSMTADAGRDPPLPRARIHPVERPLRGVRRAEQRKPSPSA